jgi:hypothetical protein
MPCLSNIPYRAIFIPEFYDPFGSPVFSPKRKKLKGYQKNKRK